MIFLKCETFFENKFALVNIKKIISIELDSDNFEGDFIKIKASDEDYKVIKIEPYMNELYKKYINLKNMIEDEDKGFKTYEYIMKTMIASIVMLINSNPLEYHNPNIIFQSDILDKAIDEIKKSFPELKEKI